MTLLHGHCHVDRAVSNSVYKFLKYSLKITMGIDVFNSVTGYIPTTPNSAVFTRPH